MSLENQVTRVSQGMKDTLKTLINKLGGNVTDELIDQYPDLAASLEQVDAAGSAAQALSDAKSYTDQKNAAMSTHATNADIHVTADEKSAWNDGIRIGDVVATLPASAGWASIAYGNGAFVAVGGYSSIVAHSDDGRRWSKVSMPADTYWSTVSFGNGKFVVLSSNSNIAAYSEDGLRWTQTTMPVSGSWYSSAYGNGKFVAIINGSDIAAYSTDGIQWTQTSMPSSGNWCSIAYGADKFVAVATGASGFTLSSSKLAAYSSDGISWKKVSLPVHGYWESVSYGNGTFITVSRGYQQYNTLQKTDKFCYSTTGTAWSYSTLPITSNWQAVTYGGDLFVAITTGSTSAAYSTDGQTWTSATLPTSARWSSIVYGNNQFIAVASGTGAYAYSADGKTWENTTDGLTTASGTDVTAEVKEIIGSSSSNVPHASTHATGGSDPITPAAIGAYTNGIKGAVNCNNISDGAWTISASATNGPGAFACTLFHKDWNADFASQIAFGADHNVYYRVKTGGSWLAWQEMYSTLRYPSPSKIGAVSKSGDTMTGNLSIMTNAVPSIILNSDGGTANIFKNASAEVEDGTHIQDRDNNDKSMSLILRGAAELDNCLLVNFNGTLYPVLHTGNLSEYNSDWVTVWPIPFTYDSLTVYTSPDTDESYKRQIIDLPEVIDCSAYYYDFRFTVYGLMKKGGTSISEKLVTANLIHTVTTYEDGTTGYFGSELYYLQPTEAVADMSSDLAFPGIYRMTVQNQPSTGYKCVFYEGSKGGVQKSFGESVTIVSSDTLGTNKFTKLELRINVGSSPKPIQTYGIKFEYRKTCKKG